MSGPPLGHRVPQLRAHLTLPPPPPTHTHLKAPGHCVKCDWALATSPPPGCGGPRQQPYPMASPWLPASCSLSEPAGSLLSSKAFPQAGAGLPGDEGGRWGVGSMLYACPRPFTHLQQCRLLKHDLLKCNSHVINHTHSAYVVQCFLTTHNPSLPHVPKHRQFLSSQSPKPPRTSAPSQLPAPQHPATCWGQFCRQGDSAVLPGLTRQSFPHDSERSP